MGKPAFFIHEVLGKIPFRFFFVPSILFFMGKPFEYRVLTIFIYHHRFFCQWKSNPIVFLAKLFDLMVIALFLVFKIVRWEGYDLQVFF